MFLPKYRLVNPFTEPPPTWCERPPASRWIFSPPWSLLVWFLTKTMLLSRWTKATISSNWNCRSEQPSAVCPSDWTSTGDTWGWTWSEKETHCRWTVLWVGWHGFKSSGETSALLKIAELISGISCSEIQTRIGGNSLLPLTDSYKAKNKEKDRIM